VEVFIIVGSVCLASSLQLREEAQLVKQEATARKVQKDGEDIEDTVDIAVTVVGVDIEVGEDGVDIAVTKALQARTE